MIEPYFEIDNGRLYHGGCLDILKQMPDESIDCVVTSPPYWGLRNYSTDGQIGLEPTIQEYIDVMTEIFSEVKRVLKDDGTLWLNMGDTYATKSGTYGGDEKYKGLHKGQGSSSTREQPDPKVNGLKHKDLCGMPWRVAFALQADGWYLRSDIIWHKPNPMPESVTDRPTKSHEYIFLMSKSTKYYYDAEAIKEQSKYPNGPNSPQNIKSPYGQGFTRKNRSPTGWDTGNGDHKNKICRYKPDKQRGHGRRHAGFNDRWDHMTKEEQCSKGANKRTVWTIPTQGYSEAHFATYPVNLIYPCIKAGCRPGGTVLDPFMGSGTTAIVAERLNRKWDGIEINQDYCDIAVDRIKKETAQYKLELTYGENKCQSN